ncbi:DUF616 domain-containing protein [Algoriphagus aestuariicola]|jgi:hypothetical protein|uniref:DUF616 domain-containing protein n=1 Tax=Algoriphagus aestuariicola TaxID=1852016 RepID=A0ABS3BKS3_9BACT|nr:glycosyltransferase domain-containing protein [Algoriphagus aestuariicola]MBN7799893.1 DUF616 domain-containing protein [Algoriphagus aestuariicola]
MDEVRKGRLVVYIALFGDYDRLIDPIGKFDRVDFVCFTDQVDLKSDIWQIRQVCNTELSSLELNRMYKFFPHRFLGEYEISFYVDSNIRIKNAANRLFRQLIDSNYTFALPDHFGRRCVYDEANVIILSRKGNEEVVNSQMKGYEAEGFPVGFGLTENNLLFRRHTDPKVIKTMELWWEEFQNKSKRDQLSLMYVLWKSGLDFTTGVFSSRRSPYFSMEPHKGAVTRFTKLIGYVRFKRFYDSNQPLPRVFDYLDRIYGKIVRML